MRLMKILTCTFITYLFSGTSLFAQNQNWEASNKGEALASLTRINTVMLTARTLQMNVYQSVFDLSQNTMVVEGNGFYKRKDSIYTHSRVFGIETIQNKEYKAVIDSSSKTIMLHHSVASTPSVDLGNIETYFNLYPVQQIRKCTLENGDELFEIHFKKEAQYPIETLSFSQNSQGLLTELTMILNEEVNNLQGGKRSKISIQYSEHRLNEKMKSEEFSLNNILTFKQGEPQPVKAYADYEFVNTLNK